MLVNQINIKKTQIYFKFLKKKKSQETGSCNPSFAWGLSRKKKERNSLTFNKN